MSRSQFTNVVIGIVVLLFVAHQLLQKVYEVQLPFLDAYLDPFLGSILFLYLFSIDPFRTVPLSYATLLMALLSFITFSEVVLVIIAPTAFVADGWDVLSIVFGFGVYVLLMKKNKISTEFIRS